MLLLALEDRMAATAFWPNTVLPELKEAIDKVELLTVEFPTLEAILSKQPDFLAAMLVTLLGPDSKVAKREDFAALDIPSYLSPSACATTDTSGDACGRLDEFWSMDLVYKEIDDLSRIFDVADRGQALIADFKAREAALHAQFDDREDLTFLFWFSSPSPADDAYLGGGSGPSGYIAAAPLLRNALASDTPDDVLTESILRTVSDVEAGGTRSPHHGRPHIHFIIARSGPCPAFSRIIPMLDHDSKRPVLNAGAQGSSPSRKAARGTNDRRCR